VSEPFRRLSARASTEFSKAPKKQGRESVIQITLPAAAIDQIMPKCETCGNEYDKSFVVVMDGESHIFDSFECAIHSLAPTCEHCGCRILGHGLEAEGSIFCCAHCAKHEGATLLRGRA